MLISVHETVDTRGRSSVLARAALLGITLLLAILALTFGPLGGSAFAAPSVAQCNGVANTGGLELLCDVTVTNTLDVATGVGSSVVTLRECHGAANTANPVCTTTTTTYDTLSTSVDQCNDAANGGGSNVVCTVHVINQITGTATSSGVTVNQCGGSGAGGPAPSLNCDPFPATTTGATITQCNGSTNGGGAPNRVECTVAPSTQSAQLAVSINQCNGAANGGGSLVTCTVSLVNTITAVPTPTPTPTAAAVTPTPVATSAARNTLHDSRTDGIALAGSATSGPGSNPGVWLPLQAGLLVLILGVAASLGFIARSGATRR
jgi:hypothetical protein